MHVVISLVHTPTLFDTQLDVEWIAPAMPFWQSEPCKLVTILAIGWWSSAAIGWCEGEIHEDNPIHGHVTTVTKLILAGISPLLDSGCSHGHNRWIRRASTAVGEQKGLLCHGLSAAGAWLGQRNSHFSLIDGWWAVLIEVWNGCWMLLLFDLKYCKLVLGLRLNMVEQFYSERLTLLFLHLLGSSKAQRLAGHWLEAKGSRINHGPKQSCQDCISETCRNYLTSMMISLPDCSLVRPSKFVVESAENQVLNQLNIMWHVCVIDYQTVKQYETLSWFWTPAWQSAALVATLAGYPVWLTIIAMNGYKL